MKRTQPVNLQLVIEKRKKANGLTNGRATSGNGLPKDINSRSFETRLSPRYDKMPLLPKNLPTPSFSESSEKILKERYLLKGGNLEVVETIAERFWHVAYDIASAEFDFGAGKEEVHDKSLKFYRLMVQQEFLPNSPTIMNAGKQNGLQYSACFVLPVEDSLTGIFDAIKYAALIHQTGGGTGFAFSRLRPNGSRVRTTGGVASGPVSFLRVFNAATESIKQGGTRRGANMGILRVDHPDVMDFIRCKSELDETHAPVYAEVAPSLPNEGAKALFKRLLLDRQIANFNISVGVTDKFMKAYYKDEDYDLVDPHTGEVTDQLNAKAVFDEIIERAWDCADPGLVFLDRINNSPANPMGKNGKIEATNPCGEQPLEAWDACNLGSINLGKFVLDERAVDWENLREVTHLSVNFLDNVVQVNPYTLPQIYNKVHNVRRIGLGVMGWADMLFKMKIAYDSEEAIKLAEEVMKFINEEGHKASEELARVRGVFPDWHSSIYSDSSDGEEFKDRPESSAFKKGQRLRNSTITTIAPTGTISIIGDCSSGIEPVFALAYIHRAKGDGGKTGNEMRILTIANKTFEEIAKSEGFYSEDLGQKVLEHGSVYGMDDVVPVDWQKVFVTAPQISPEWHVKMQAAFQKYTDNGVSKTINLPSSATIEDVKRAYLMSWETGCNGITVYRDGSKTTQVLNVSSTLKKTISGEAKAEQTNGFVHRPVILRGRTYKIQTPVGEGYITINRDEKDEPFEIFINIGKGGMHTMADAEAIGRLASLTLRISRGGQVSPKEVAQKIISQLRGIGGGTHVGFGKERVMSLADAIAKALTEDLAVSSEPVEPVPLSLSEAPASGSTEESAQQQLMLNNSSQVDLCPECGDAAFVREDGCEKCYSCGFSKC